MKNKTLSEDDKRVWDEFSKDLQSISNADLKRSYVLKPDREELTRDFENKRSTITSKLEKRKSEKIDYHQIGEKMIDKKKLRELKRGKIKPEAVLDLHGLRRDEAKKNVINFLDESIRKSLRFILIITGKGNKASNHEQIGVLRKELPYWISNSNQADKILAVFPASINHGGSGAFYIYIRKKNL